MGEKGRERRFGQKVIGEKRSKVLEIGTLQVMTWRKARKTQKNEGNDEK